MLNNFLRWRPAPNDVAPNVFDSYAYLVAKNENLFESIEEQFHLRNIAYAEMDTLQLERLAFNAVCWNQEDILKNSTKILRCRVPVDDKFYHDLLFYAITRNDGEAVNDVASVSPELESKVVSALRDAAAFVTEGIIIQLAKLAKITPKDLVLKKVVPEFPSYRMVHHFASTTNAGTFLHVLLFLPRDSVFFTSTEFLDNLQRNVLMWAVSSKEVLVQILERAKRQKDFEALLKQKDCKVWSCLRHACHVHNLAVVKTLIGKTDFFNSWREDLDVENVPLIEFVDNFKIFHIKDYLLKLSTSQAHRVINIG